MAKTLSEMPTRLALPFIYMLISFWMAAVSASFTVFLASTACTLMVRTLGVQFVGSFLLRLFSYLIVSFSSISFSRQSVLAGESLGLLVGTTIYDMEKALIVMTVFSLFLMLLGGFFVQNIPAFVAWAKYVSPFKYAFDASLEIVFNSDVQCDGSGALEELCGGASTGSVPPEDVLEFLGVQGSVGFNVGILCVLIFIPRFVAYRALRSKRGGERS